MIHVLIAIIYKVKGAGMFLIVIIRKFNSMLLISKYLMYNNTYKILFILSCVFFFFGCSSTYRITDFSSKEKFYKDFNSFAKNRNVNVRLVNDSTFSSPNGAIISNDSLRLIDKVIK